MNEVRDDNEADLKAMDEGAAQYDRDMEKDEAMLVADENVRADSVIRFKRYSKSSECDHDWRRSGMFLMKMSDTFSQRANDIVGGLEGPLKTQTPEVEVCHLCGLLRIPPATGEVQTGKVAPTFTSLQ